MNKVAGIATFLIIGVMLLAGCGGGSSAPNAVAANPAELNASNLNLIFVVSEDLAYHARGDVNPDTANLTAQGLRRSLMMASFLRRRVLGRKNVSGVYALEPMTHLQTEGDHPDMAAPETIEQFALLNQITLSAVFPPPFVPYRGNSYPLNASYASGSVPSAAATPAITCATCQGLDFADEGNDNENLVSGIIATGLPGFYVFSAPWETISALLANINTLKSYQLTLPANYQGPNFIYAMSITPSGTASLVTFNSDLKPSATYPALPAPRPRSTPCGAQTPFVIQVTGGSGGAVIPAGTNTNETVYMIRHVEAHPQTFWDDGNYICAGQWRALDLPNALRSKIHPDQVYSVDPAQVIPGTASALGTLYSYVRPSLTVEPYAIANNLPYDLAAGIELFDENSPPLTSNFFFTGGQFSNHTVLMAWEHEHIPPTVDSLIASYFSPSAKPPVAGTWPSDDYDTIWTVKLDAEGNLAVNNSLCEGIDSAALPATCPQF